MTRIIITPEGKKIDLDRDPPSIDELCEKLLKPLADETNLSVEFLKTGKRVKIEKALASIGINNKPLIREYKSTGYPIGNRYTTEEKLKERRNKIKKFLDNYY